ncbi:MAG: hypothetical protein LBN27_01950 [Prevotellaceae bacterium]|jgi:hypothetical protein|nr:hypothetical protein [Prevotellaceae bacterium]
MAKITAYKGHDKDFKCRGFQYEVGKEYEEDEASICNSGFHACENPIDVFGYYAPADGRYSEVELDANNETDDDSKRVGKKIKIKSEIGINGIVDAFLKFTFEKIDFLEKAATNTGCRSAATNTGYQSAATNIGNQSAATNTGNRSAATNTGDQSAATNTGNRSAATNTGDRSAATNTGYRSAATNTGDRSAATNTGYQSAATNTGSRSAATNTGSQSAATVEGKYSVACALGIRSKARANKGSAIVVAERNDNGDLLEIKAAIVDGVLLKENTFYLLVNGELVEEKEV